MKVIRLYFFIFCKVEGISIFLKELYCRRIWEVGVGDIVEDVVFGIIFLFSSFFRKGKIRYMCTIDMKFFGGFIRFINDFEIIFRVLICFFFF